MRSITSIVARIKDEEGIDEDSVEMRIENEPVDIRVQEVNSIEFMISATFLIENINCVLVYSEI